MLQFANNMIDYLNNMEKHKYYVPTIEEFHVGFEYEYKSHDGRVYSKDEFDKMPWLVGIMGINDMPYIVRSLIGANSNHSITIRVKHLDEEDILSCGWVENSKWSYKWPTPYDEGDGEYYNKRYYYVSIHKGGEVIIHNNEEYDNQVDFFRGIIKNKSELIRVMKMIGITK